VDLVTSICFDSHVSATDTLMLLIRQRSQFIEDIEPSYLPETNSLFIMCIGVIINNSLVDGRSRAEAQTSFTEHVTLYCTWRPSAL